MPPPSSVVPNGTAPAPRPTCGGKWARQQPRAASRPHGGGLHRAPPPRAAPLTATVAGPRCPPGHLGEATSGGAATPGATNFRDAAARGPRPTGETVSRNTGVVLYRHVSMPLRRDPHPAPSRARRRSPAGRVRPSAVWGDAAARTVSAQLRQWYSCHGNGVLPADQLWGGSHFFHLRGRRGRGGARRERVCHTLLGISTRQPAYVPRPADCCTAVPPPLVWGMAPLTTVGTTEREGGPVWPARPTDK